jgi:hypothetical protein
MRLRITTQHRSVCSTYINNTVGLSSPGGLRSGAESAITRRSFRECNPIRLRGVSAGKSRVCRPKSARLLIPRFTGDASLPGSQGAPLKASRLRVHDHFAFRGEYPESAFRYPGCKQHGISEIRFGPKSPRSRKDSSSCAGMSIGGAAKRKRPLRWSRKRASSRCQNGNGYSCH